MGFNSGFKGLKAYKIVKEMKKYYKASGKEYPTYGKKEGRLTGLVTSGAENAFQNTLLKKKGRGKNKCDGKTRKKTLAATG